MGEYVDQRWRLHCVSTFGLWWRGCPWLSLALLPSFLFVRWRGRLSGYRRCSFVVFLPHSISLPIWLLPCLTILIHICTIPRPPISPTLDTTSVPIRLFWFKSVINNINNFEFFGRGRIPWILRLQPRRVIRHPHPQVVLKCSFKFDGGWTVHCHRTDY